MASKRLPVEEEGRSMPMTEATARQLAAEAGVSLVRSNFNKTGYTGVSHKDQRHNKPYEVKLVENKKFIHLGYYSGVRN